MSKIKKKDHVLALLAALALGGWIERPAAEWDYALNMYDNDCYPLTGFQQFYDTLERNPTGYEMTKVLVDTRKLGLAKWCGMMRDQIERDGYWRVLPAEEARKFQEDIMIKRALNLNTQTK